VNNEEEEAKKSSQIEDLSTSKTPRPHSSVKEINVAMENNT
jgi:hypothetical protein